ncbi:MAG: hypothetical protein GY832_30980 [Chloroflexi bacterium]|nr:hypothetical protein [Chloroflexota bacterium]
MNHNNQTTCENTDLRADIHNTIDEYNAPYESVAERDYYHAMGFWHSCQRVVDIIRANNMTNAV